MFRIALRFSVLLLLLGESFLEASAKQPAPSLVSAHSVKCPVRRMAPSEAEVAYARERFDEAVRLFREEAKGAGAEADRAHDGLIRALLHARKFSEAEADATAWNKADPKNAWSRIALAEVQWRRGKVGEGLDSIVAAAALDPCNSQMHADYARVQAMSGLMASAKRNLDIAHSLEPESPAITDDWVRFQPRAVQLANLITYVAGHQDLSDEERKSLESQKKALSAPTGSRCELVGPVQSTSLPYRGIQDGPRAPVHWGLDVGFNGKSRRLEIDTGAHGLLLTHSAAAALHLVPISQGKTSGIGDEGEVNSFTAMVESIRIGGLEFHNCNVEVLGKTITTMQAREGLIGGDVFANFLLTLDFPGRVLKLDPLPKRAGESVAADTPSLATGAEAGDEVPTDRYIDPTMKTWTKVFRAGHDLILPMQLNDGPWRLFIVDTGSGLNLISNEAAREVAKVSNGSAIQLYGISGEVKKLSTTGPLTLTFANLKQPASGMTAMDTSRLGDEAGVEIAGFLGAPTLHQLTVQIDYRDNLVHFSYDPNRIQHCSATSLSGVSFADCY